MKNACPAPRRRNASRRGNSAGTGRIEEAVVRGQAVIGKKHLARGLGFILAGAVGLAAFGSRSVAGDGDGPGADPETLSVAGVIERYVEACGGPALAEVRSEKRKGSLVRGRSGQVPFEMTSRAQGKWLYNQVFAYGDQVSYGCDGTAAWIQDTRGVSPLTGAMRLDLEMLLDVQAPLRLHELFPEMRLRGVEKRGDRDVILIQAKSRDGEESELAFEAATGLLTKAGDLAFEDYRPVGKVKRPYRVYVGDDPGGLALRLRMDFTEIVPNAPVDDSAFNRPACVLPIKASPLYKPRRYITVSDEALEACVGVYQHPANTGLKYTVTRQRNHLMMERTGWGLAFEIKPESEWDYSIRFLNVEFLFVRDPAGRVTALELGPERAVRAERMK